jgi:hypothetical protein
MRVRIPHLGKQFLFALLSGTDLVLTWWLIGNTAGQVYEVNPIASWWLTRFGWIGLVCFKALIVLVVLGLSAVIHYSRPRAAERILRLACASLTIVVLYSTGLCLAAHFAPWESDEEKELAALNADTGRVFQQREAFVNLLADLREDILAERCTLREATDRLAATDAASLRPHTALYPNRPLAESLAAFLITHVVNLQKSDPQRAWQISLRLKREYQRTFGHSTPTTLSLFFQDVARPAVKDVPARAVPAGWRLCPPGGTRTVALPRLSSGRFDRSDPQLAIHSGFTRRSDEFGLSGTVFALERKGNWSKVRP